MKYFTRGWANGEFSEAEGERIRDAYWEHVRGLSPRLPGPVAQLANEVELHDAIIGQVRVNIPRRELKLALLCPELQGGREVELRYSGAPLGDAMVQMLKDRARDRATCILYDEVDIDEDGEFVHRLLFGPEGEISIWFREIEVRIGGQADGRVRLAPYFLDEGEEPARPTM